MLQMKAIIDAVVPEPALLLAGSLGKDRVIMGLCVIDREDAVDGLRKNDLVYLTGTDKSLEKLLGMLVEEKADLLAGVIVNTQDYKQSVPVDIIMKYDQAHIPLISLDWESDEGELQQFFFKQMLHTSSHDNDRKYKKYVLEKLLHDKFSPYLDYNEIFAVQSTNTLTIGIVEIDDIPLTDFQELEQLFMATLQALYVTITEWHNQRQILILKQTKSGEDVYDFQRLLEKTLKPFDYAYRIGLSSNSTHWENLSFSYEEAQMSIFIACQLGQKLPFVAVFQDMKLLKIIKNIPDTKLLENYVHETLGKLVLYDRKHGTDTLEFLKIWIMYNGNTPKIAADMYLHRNTVHYRINKVKEILGYSEWNYPIICNLCFAFLVRRALRMEG